MAHRFLTAMNQSNDLLDWAQLRDLFHQALDLPHTERQRWLAQLHLEQPALHQELQSLLAEVPAAATARLSQMAPDLIEDLGQHPSRDPLGLIGQTLGSWQVQALIGEGGMGAVYRVARQHAGFEQIGALKTLASDPSNRDLTRRFESERQMLAHLDHPNIARILDGGTLASGTPYFVMSFIDGLRIDHYCHRHDLNLEARLRLFLTICDAVSSAHRALIVHRDLKPANILVDQHGAVHLLDFGIAKWLDSTRGAPTQTLDQRRLLTLRYGSPEQIQGEAITTACDQFALGVILYELILGEWPFGSAKTEPLAMAKAIVEQEPRAFFGMTPSVAIPRDWRADLEAILGKCLRKRATDRYPSVDALAEDLRALMAGDPVKARAGNRRYAWQKWLRRHRWAVTAAAAILLGVVSTAWTWRAQREAARTAAIEAQAAEQRAMTVAGFLDTLLTSVDPSIAQGRDTSLLRELLTRANARIDTELAAEPTVRMELKQTIANSLIALGEGQAALAVIEPQFQTLGDDLSSDSARRIAEIQIDALLGAGKPEPAEALAQRLFATEQAQLGIDHGSTLATASIVVRLLTQRRALQEAKAFAQSVLEQTSAKADPEQKAIVQTELVQALSLLGEHASAKQLLDTAIASLQSVLGTESLRVLQARTQRGMLAFYAGDPAGAAAIYQDLLLDHQRLFGLEHPKTLNVQSNLASALGLNGQLTEAIALIAPVYEINRKQLGPTHRQTLTPLGSLASLELRAGQIDAALTHFETYLAACEAAFGVGHDSCVDRQVGYGKALLAKDRFAEAAKQLETAYAGKLRAQGQNFSKAEAVAAVLVELYTRWQRPQQAAHWQSRAQTAPTAPSKPNASTR